MWTLKGTIGEWSSVWDRRTGVKDVGVIRIKVTMKMQTVGALGLWGGHGEQDRQGWDTESEEGLLCIGRKFKSLRIGKSGLN